MKRENHNCKGLQTVHSPRVDIQLYQLRVSAWQVRKMGRPHLRGDRRYLVVAPRTYYPTHSGVPGQERWQRCPNTPNSWLGSFRLLFVPEYQEHPERSLFWNHISNLNAVAKAVNEVPLEAFQGAYRAWKRHWVKEHNYQRRVTGRILSVHNDILNEYFLRT